MDRTENGKKVLKSLVSFDGCEGVVQNMVNFKRVHLAFKGTFILRKLETIVAICRIDQCHLTKQILDALITCTDLFDMGVVKVRSKLRIFPQKEIGDFEAFLCTLF